MRTGRFLNRTLLPFLFALVIVLSGCKKTVEEKTNSGLTIGYATKGVVITEDPNALQKAYDAAVAAGAGNKIAVLYAPEAYSKDGITFSCHIGNSTANVDDLFLAIYGDPDLTDELFVSELLRPGTAFEEITLNHALDPGVNTVYTAFTTVVHEEEEILIHNQAVVTIDFVVEE